jgi:hypothetical protein
MSNLKWRKSTRSTGGGQACVEVAPLPDAVAVRDSKSPTGGMLTFQRDQWQTFADAVRAGRYDL